MASYFPWDKILGIKGKQEEEQDIYVVEVKISMIDLRRTTKNQRIGERFWVAPFSNKVNDQRATKTKTKIETKLNYLNFFWRYMHPTWLGQR